MAEPRTLFSFKFSITKVEELPKATKSVRSRVTAHRTYGDLCNWCLTWPILQVVISSGQESTCKGTPGADGRVSRRTLTFGL